MSTNRQAPGEPLPDPNDVPPNAHRLAILPTRVPTERKTDSPSKRSAPSASSPIVETHPTMQQAVVAAPAIVGTKDGANRLGTGGTGRSLSAPLPLSASDTNSLRLTQERAEQVIQTFQGLRFLVKAPETVLSFIPLLEPASKALKLLRQMLEVAQAVKENELDAMGLVHDSAEIVRAVYQMIDKDPSRIEEGTRQRLDQLCNKLSENIVLLTRMKDARSIFKVFLNVDKRARQIRQARDQMLLYIAIFSLESVLSHDKLLQTALEERRQDQANHDRRIAQYAKDPQKAVASLLRSEEMTEAYITLKRESEVSVKQKLSITAPAVSTSQDNGPAELRTPLEFSHVRPTDSRESITSSSIFTFNEQLPAISGTSEVDLPVAPLDLVTHKERVSTQDLFVQRLLGHLEGLTSGSVDLSEWIITEFEIYRGERINYFAEVYRGWWKNKVVAIKDMRLSTDKDTFLEEVKLWQSLECDFIVPFWGAASATGPQPWFMVSPWYKNGHIDEYLRKAQEVGKIVNRVILLQQIARGMQYLHSKNIVHGDLKGQNVLIDDTECARICDFGSAGLHKQVGTGGSTAQFLAPELKENKMITKEGDVYSYGALMYQVLTGQDYVQEMQKNKVKNDIFDVFGESSLGLPEDYKECLWWIIQECRKKDPRDRIKFYKIVKSLELLATAINFRKNVQSSFSGRSSESSTSSLEVDHSDSTSSAALTPKGPAVTLASSTLSEEVTARFKDTVNVKQPNDDEADTTFLPHDLYRDIRFRQQSPQGKPLLADHAEHERQYRQSFCYDLFPKQCKLNLPLWEPVRVSIGDVGLIREGSFQRVANAYNNNIGPEKSSSLIPNDAKNVKESVVDFWHPEDVQDLKLKIMGHSVQRRYTYPIGEPNYNPEGKTAMLVVSKGTLRSLNDCSSLRDFTKRNIEAIIGACKAKFSDSTKADIVVVVGVLIAEKYAIALLNNVPDAKLTFNVLASHKGRDDSWGFWTIMKGYQYSSVSGEDQLKSPISPASGSRSTPLSPPTPQRSVSRSKTSTPTPRKVDPEMIVQEAVPTAAGMSTPELTPTSDRSVQFPATPHPPQGQMPRHQSSDEQIEPISSWSRVSAPNESEKFATFKLRLIELMR